MLIRRRIRLVAACALLLTGLTTGLAHAQSETPHIVGLQLDGVVDDIVADYLSSNIARASEAGAPAILLEIDTPGGLGSSMEQISKAILASDVPVIGYVTPSGARAASAGAIILLSCPVAAMAPGTHVGAATPVGLNGGDLSRKIAQDAEANARSLAQTYGRNEDVAAAFVSEGRSITAEEALDQDIIEYIEPSAESLLAAIDGTTVHLSNGSTVTMATAGVPVQMEEIGGFVGFLHGLFDPSLAFLFFWLGLALIILEIIVPGHIFSGTIGTAMLLISLWSFGLLPVRWIGIVLLVISVVAFVLELKAPGLGIWGALGLVTLLLGGWFLYDRSGGVSVSPAVLLATAGIVALFFGFVVAKALAIRRMPAPAGARSIVGTDGVALAGGVDADHGLVRVAAEEWGAVSESGPISEGTPIRVTKLDGLVLTVEALHTEHDEADAPAAVSEGG